MCDERFFALSLDSRMGVCMTEHEDCFVGVVGTGCGLDDALSFD